MRVCVRVCVHVCVYVWCGTHHVCVRVVCECVYDGCTASDASVRGMHLIAGASVVYCDGESVRVWIEWMCV